MTAAARVGPSPVGGGPVPLPDLEDVAASIAYRIRAERQARGWAQNALAVRCGGYRQLVRHLEEGRGLTVENLTRICWALGITVSALVSDAWTDPAAGPAGHRLTPKQQEVLKAVAAGGTLLDAGRRIGMTRQQVGARLSEVYRALGVADQPDGKRRAAAVRIATEHGLIDAA